MRRFEIHSGNLRRCALTIAAIWLLAQLVVIVVYWGEPQYSDAANYMAFANEAYLQGHWYPSADDITSRAWIANTGYINFLILNLRLFGTLTLVPLLQLLVNCWMLLSVKKLTSAITGSEECSWWSVIVFCLCLSNIFTPALFMSDLLGVALLLGSLTLIRRKVWMVTVSGVLIVAANWVRPVAVLYLPAIFAFVVYRRFPLKYYAGYFAGAAVTAAAIWMLTTAWCGHGLLSSTTGGTNYIQGANDDARGMYCAEVFEPGKAGYIPDSLDYNVFQRDSALTARAIEWIGQNPGRFAVLAPRKMFRLWAADCYHDKVLTDSSPLSASGENLAGKAAFSIPYYIAIILMLIGIWAVRRRLWGYWGIFLIPLLVGCVAHIFIYGGMRYHYPMLPVVYLYAAVGLGYLTGGFNPSDAPARPDGCK